MIQSDPYNALKLAKTGDPKAIQNVINYLLKDKEVTTKVLLKNDAIHIILEFEESIGQSISALSIIQVLNKINAPDLNTAVIQAKIKGKVNPIWTECIQLNSQAEAEIIPTKQKKTSRSFHWPAWFPYPSSWLRSVILLLWVGIVVRIFGYWGMFFGDLISRLADHPILFLQILGVSLLGSCLVLSYIYHLIDFKKSSKWFPRPIKLWEGIYAPLVFLMSIIIVILIGHPFIPWNDCTLSVIPQSSYCSRIVDSYITELTDFEVIIWLGSILYFYQIEYLLRLYFPFKKFLKFTAISLLTGFTMITIQFTFNYWDYIYGAMTALTTPKTEQINPVNTTVTPTPKTEQINPVNTTITKTEALIPSTKTTKTDPFQAAVNQAIIAAELTQSAQSPLEWQQVANHWQSALELMKAVPQSHSHYAVAQDRVSQYQKNLDYADKNSKHNHRQ